MSETLEQLVIRVQRECEGKNMKELVDMATKAIGTPRGNVIVVYTATKVDIAWRRDLSAVNFYNSHEEIFANSPSLGSSEIVRFAINCTEHAALAGKKTVCVNCRAYDMEFFKRNAFKHLIAIQGCRLIHGVDLDEEMKE